VDETGSYVNVAATDWCVEKRISLIGFDFYHGLPDPMKTNIRNVQGLCARGIITMPYICNLDQISKRRVTLMAFPLNMIGVEASPVRAIVIEH
jgi:kynurenine formamidase